SREMLGLARENARASRSDSAIGFMMGDLVRLPVRSDTFDVALLLETLLHLPAPMGALRELHRAIRPEGFAIVTTNGANPISRLTHPPTRGRHAAPPWKLALATAVNETMTALWGFCWSKSPITARLYKRFFDAPVRPLYPWQVRRMLKAAGFSTVYHSPWPSRLLPWEHRWLAIK
ncbi:MAG: class I SAM-dependent methyltransferase, partial [Candidatus Methylomirabilales bacterium]